MDLESATCHQEKEKQGQFGRGWSWIKAFPKNVKIKVFEFVSKLKKLGQDDPRKVIHSLKPLYDSFGVSATFAVITILFVLEFSVGVIRGLATLLAGAPAVGAHHLANLSGCIGEPIVLGFFVFLQSGVFTFARFFPKNNARYDYGLLIFTLTFVFISVSGYQDDEILELAYKRLSTMLLGSFTCIIVSIMVFPVWAGEDLRILIASNMEKLGSFLEDALVSELKAKDKKSFGFFLVLISDIKSLRLVIVIFRLILQDGNRCMYLKIRALIRRCAYRIESLNGHLNSGIQAKAEIPSKNQRDMEFALSIKTMMKPFPADIHIQNSKSAAKSLNSLQIIFVPVAPVDSLLIDVVNCTQEIAEAVHELTSIVNFKAIQPTVSPEEPETAQPKIVKSSNDVVFFSI
ncbi:hypothetical protein ES288_A04G143700v1 [Gossypium darwinii]|uniref:Aluminum-activated malate transporter n=1 Tax=Gossypium darwinii TaxID=34276 RepID=A0A5D2GXP0_GOSDA|nr:hypothetical protein ES288_A04G143700v1 [Gossypium darwinii]